MSVASKPKKNARYDLKAADRKRNLFVQIGLTSIVVLFAAALILYILMSADEKPLLTRNSIATLSVRAHCAMTSRRPSSTAASLS